MASPFAPKYFIDFYRKYPADRESIMELERDMWTEEERRDHSRMKYSVTSLGFIFIYTMFKREALPIFAKYGKIFKTHRIFRQYSYALIISLIAAEYPFRNRLNKTLQKLNEIDEERTRMGELYIEPTKPIAYSFKHY